MNIDPLPPRLRQLQLHNFRGFRRTHAFDLDADLVLVTGKNGAGKTSLLRALHIALNGGDMPGLNSKRLRHIHAGKDAAWVRINDVAPIALDGDKATGSGLRNPQVALDLASAATLFLTDLVDQLDAHQAISRLQPPDSLAAAVRAGMTRAREVLAREATRYRGDAFDPDALRRSAVEAFKLAATGLHVSDFHAAEAVKRSAHGISILNGNVSAKWAAVCANIAAALSAESSEGFESFGEGAHVLATIERRLANILDRLHVVSVGAEQAGAAVNPVATALPGDIADSMALHYVEADVAAQSTWLADAIPVPIDQAGFAGLQASGERLATEHAAAKRDEAACGRRVDWLAMPEGPLEGVLVELLERLGIWWAADEVISELQSLAPEAAEFIRDARERWPGVIDALQRWREQQRQGLARAGLARRAAEQRLAQVERALRLVLADDGDAWGIALQARPSTVGALRQLLAPKDDAPPARPADSPIARVAKLRQATLDWHAAEQRIAEHRQRRQAAAGRDAAHVLLQAGVELLDGEAKRPQIANLVGTIDEATVMAAVNTLNALLERFHFPRTFLPIVPRLVGSGARKRWELATGSVGGGLGFSELSTGQRTQLAFCWTVGLHYALCDELEPAPAAPVRPRVLLLDDLTTALDLGQLVPVAITLRQLAYAADARKRRQVVLTSHHEDLTNKLIDLLLPPAGCVMKVLSFDEWTLDRGPKVSVYRTGAPDRQASADAEELIRTRLREWARGQYA